MRYALASAVIGFLVSLSPTVAQVGGLEGTWLIAAPMPDDVPADDQTIVNQPVKFAARCGVKVQVYRGKNFRNVQSDAYVIGAGPYSSDAGAQETLRQVRPCVPGAYLRRLVFVGDGS